MRLRDLAEKSVVIWGAGREAASVVRALRRFDVVPHDLVIVDEVVDDERFVEDIPVTQFSAGIIDAADIVVRSPGVSKYRPEFAQKTVTTATNLWFAEPHNHIIAITGTKGKSTTSSLTHHVLVSLGRSTRLGGNIGVSPIDQLGEEEPEFWVVEMSSFQTSDMEGHVDVAALTSFSPEHLDWHQSEANYLNDKLNLFRYADVVIVNGENQNARALQPQINNARLAIPDRFRDARPKLFGEHNRQLISLCVAILEASGIDIHAHADEIRAAIESFQPLKHRLEPVSEFGNRVWINDSLSTTPTSTVAAIHAFAEQPTTLLIGGYDRGVSYELLRPVFASHPNVTVVTMPDNGSRIAEQVPKSTQCIASDGLKHAVEIAHQVTPVGGVVLLSPAAASFGQFRDYAERGMRFAEFINALQDAEEGR